MYVKHTAKVKIFLSDGESDVCVDLLAKIVYV